MKRIIGLLLGAVLALAPVTAITDEAPVVIKVQEEDGSPSGWVYGLKVTNGQLTINADGTASLNFGTATGDISAVGDGASGAVFTADGAGNTLYFEGSTADDYEIALTAADPGADYTITLPATTGTVYVSGGTDVSLGDGGTGASLSDPGADKILFWDDSASAVTWLSVSTGLSVSGTDLTASLGTAVDTSEITDDTILAADLDATNTEADNDIVTYDSASGGFTFNIPSEIITAGTNLSWSGATLNVDDAFLVNNANDVTTGTITMAGVILEGGTYDTTLQAGTPTASVTYTLPGADGTSGYLLSTNGSGTLSWSQVGDSAIAAGAVDGGSGGEIADNTIDANDLAATLTFADGDLINLGGITMSASTDEGLVRRSLEFDQGI